MSVWSVNEWRSVFDVYVASYFVVVACFVFSFCSSVLFLICSTVYCFAKLLLCYLFLCVSVLLHTHRWIQLCCPRLSVDWGSVSPSSSSHVPLLNAYETFAALGEAPWTSCSPPSQPPHSLDASSSFPLYPMDNFARVCPAVFPSISVSADNMDEMQTSVTESNKHRTFYPGPWSNYFCL